MGDVVKFLKNTKIADLFQGEKVELVSAKTSDPAIESLRKLIKARVLSIPLYDEQKKAYTAIFDIMDVLHFVTQAGGDGTLSALEGNQLFKNKTSEEISNLSGRAHFVPISTSQPLMEALEVITQDYAQLHRLPVIDEKGKLVGILSQSRIVRFLGKHVTKFDFGRLSVKQQNLGIREVFSIGVDNPVSAALKLIKEKEVSAVAIVDKSDKLIANFSASDLKLFGYDDKICKLANEGSSLKDFAERMKPSADYPVRVTKDATTAEVIRKCSTEGVHRVYVVDNAEKPIGVISLVDIIELFVRHLLIE